MRIWFGCSVGWFVDFLGVLLVLGFFAGEAHQGTRAGWRCCRCPLGWCRVRAPGEGSRQLRRAGAWTAAAAANPGLCRAISHPPSLGTTLNAALTIRDFRVSVACRDKREPRLENPGVGAQADLVFVCNHVLSNFLFS